MAGKVEHLKVKEVSVHSHFTLSRFISLQLCWGWRRRQHTKSGNVYKDIGYYFKTRLTVRAQKHSFKYKISTVFNATKSKKI